MATQNYIGIRNGLVVCIDRYSGRDLSGRFYHGYSEEGFGFKSFDHMLEQCQSFFDELRFPFAGNSERSFMDIETVYQRPVERERLMRDDELLEKRGDLGTFIIRVQHRQNSSWQGRITWMEEDKSLNFRSVWEMMKLIDSAMKQYAPDEEEEETPNW